MIPSQNVGIETPHSDTALARRSQTVLRRTAEKTPAGMAIPMATIRAKHASSIVIGSFTATVLTTGSRVRIDSPKSPRRASLIQRKYWTGMGSFRPYFARIS